jgi:Mn-containing catalase
MNITDDTGIREALGFLMTREVAHQKSFEKALYAIQPNFTPGKLPGVPEFTNTYYDMSQGNGAAEADVKGSWNSGDQWEHVSSRDAQAAVDGGEGSASVELPEKDEAPLAKIADRTASRPDVDPTTGAELGAGPGAGATKTRKK